MMDFDPNAKKYERARVWATYVPGRRPEFKSHTQENFAKVAISYHRRGVLYKMEDGQWIEVARLESTPDHCERCDDTLQKSPYSYGNCIRWNELTPETVCYRCAYPRT